MLLALLLVGCTIPTEEIPAATSQGVQLPPVLTSQGVQPRTTTVTTTVPGEDVVVLPQAAAPREPERVAFSAMGGQFGIVLFDGSTTHTSGTLLSDVSWSTIKVPIAIAAHRAGVADQGLINRALQNSDNAAAQQLWDSLGGNQAAANAVAAEIARYSDAPYINTSLTRPGFSTFGQTEWSLDSQARFGYYLSCQSPVITTPMQNVAGDQRYGLGRLGGALFKGGWGPEEDGGYLARQFGFIPTNTGGIGVAIAAKPHDGSYATAGLMLDQLANQLADHIARQLIDGRENPVTC